MFRARLRVPRRTLLSAAAATAVVLHESPREKLSIYPEPERELVLVETPSELEKQIGVVRRRIVNTYQNSYNEVQGWVSKWINVEHAVENRVKSIAAPDESVTPGLLYIGVATLTGSIMARNRMLATRLLLPPAFLILSAEYFLPKTSANLSAYLGSLEETYFPALAQKHDVANAHTRMAWERLSEATREGREKVNAGAVVAVERLQELTGLKLRESIGISQDGAAAAEAKTQGVVGAMEEHAREAKVATEHKLGEALQKANERTEDTKESPPS